MDGSGGHITDHHSDSPGAQLQVCVSSGNVHIIWEPSMVIWIWCLGHDIQPMLAGHHGLFRSAMNHNCLEPWDHAFGSQPDRFIQVGQVFPSICGELLTQTKTDSSHDESSHRIMGRPACLPFMRDVMHLRLLHGGYDPVYGGVPSTIGTQILNIVVGSSTTKAT